MKKNLVLQARITLKSSTHANALLSKLLTAAGPAQRLLCVAAVHELRLSDSMTRVTRLNSRGKSLWSVLRTNSRGPAQFWDHEAGTAVTFGAEQLPPQVLAPPPAFKCELADGLARLEFDAPLLGRVRQELRFSRDKKWPHRQQLLEAAIGCADCHAASGVPVAQLVELGTLERIVTWFGDDKTPALDTRVQVVEARDETEQDFAVPRKFKPMQSKPLPDREPVRPTRPNRPPSHGAGAGRDFGSGVGVSRQALDATGPNTPECLTSTRLGATAFVLRQSLLDHLSTALNDTVPLVGTATLAGGTLTLPWFAALPSGTGTANAPGSGLREFLRDPRVAATPTAPASGGSGLLDRLAWIEFRRADATGLSLTQREAVAGTLAATLLRWGVSPATSALLVGAAGDFMALSVEQLLEVVEAYEITDWTVLRLGGLPSTLPPPTPTAPAPLFTPPELAGLMAFRVTGITGTTTFLSGTPLIAPLDIGNVGNITTTLMLPDITFGATVMRSLTPAGVGAIGIVSTLLCLLFPITCPATIVISLLIIMVLSNVTTLSVVTTSVSVSLDVQWRFDPASQRVQPFVRVLGTTGTATAVNRWTTPNLVANLFDSVVLGIGNLFGVWVPMLAEVMAGKLQTELRKLRIGCPFGRDSLRLKAQDGGAASLPRDHLTLFANVMAEPGLLAMPYVSQAATPEVVGMRLDDAGRAIERDMNPPPSPGSLGLGKVAAYLGVGYNQNALNQLLFQRWQSGEFELMFDVAALPPYVALWPSALQPIVKAAATLHVWCAVSPRVELSSEGMLAGRRALFAFFDDVRVCFEAPASGGDAERPDGGVLAEFTFNFKTTATLTLEWPAVSRVLFDRQAFVASDRLSWELVDPRRALPLPFVGMQAFEPLTAALATQLLAGSDAFAAQPPSPPPPAWMNPMPALAETLAGGPALPAFVGQLWLQLLGERRALHALPVLKSDLLQLVDGSGAPLLGSLVSAGRPLTLGTLRANEGTKLRDWLAVIPDSKLPLP